MNIMKIIRNGEISNEYSFLINISRLYKLKKLGIPIFGDAYNFFKEVEDEYLDVTPFVFEGESCYFNKLGRLLYMIDVDNVLRFVYYKEDAKHFRFSKILQDFPSVYRNMVLDAVKKVNPNFEKTAYYNISPSRVDFLENVYYYSQIQYV